MVACPRSHLRSHAAALPTRQPPASAGPGPHRDALGFHQRRDVRLHAAQGIRYQLWRLGTRWF